MSSQRNGNSPIRLIFAYRNRLSEAIAHDVRSRYVGSIFGSMWAVLFPLMQLSIYAVIYAFIFRVRPTGLTEFSYSLLVFSGLVPLMAFSETLMGATNSLSANKALLTNTVFPAELIPLRAGLAAHIPSLVGLAITLLFGMALGRTSWWAIVLVPILWINLLMFATGIGWVLSLLVLVAKDIQHGIGLVMMLVFVLSPFAYTPEMVPQALRALIWINPLSYFVLSFQQLICYGSLPGLTELIGALCIGPIGLFGGFATFQRGKKVFFDYA